MTDRTCLGPVPPPNGPRPGVHDGSGGRQRTPDQILGPYFPVGRMPHAGCDLTIVQGRQGRAQGEIIEVTGRVLNRDGEPVRGARLVIWQANSFGRYSHPSDQNSAPLDPNFVGFARFRSGRDGRYRIRTVKPGLYPVEPDWYRPPHIHFEVRSKFGRLITQMYFASEPLNTEDRILASASRPELLIAAPAAFADGLGLRIMKFDIVLAGG
jgi:protocatechuate 3,4-dioxygenase, beta subunit